MLDNNALQQQLSQWLYSHIDIPFPTKQSVQGWTLFQEVPNVIEGEKAIKAEQIEWVWVSFHKLTVWFSQYFASCAYDNQQQQDTLIEFITQIELDSEGKYQLFMLTVPATGDVVGCGFTVNEQNRQHILRFAGEVSLETAQQLLN